MPRCCHCEERSDVAIAMTDHRARLVIARYEAIHGAVVQGHGLPRYARNDGCGGMDCHATLAMTGAGAWIATLRSQ